MRIYTIITFCVVFLLMTGCARVQVSHDYDREFIFDQQLTFGWDSNRQPHREGPLKDNELLARRFRTAIEAFLTARGYAFTASPELFISYTYTVTSRLQTEPVSSGFQFAYGRYGNHGGLGINSGSVIRHYDQGLLVVDIVSAHDGKLLWKGKGTREVFTHSDPDELTKMVTEMAESVLRQFPPSPN